MQVTYEAVRYDTTSCLSASAHSVSRLMSPASHMKGLTGLLRRGPLTRVVKATCGLRSRQILIASHAHEAVIARCK